MNEQDFRALIREVLLENGFVPSYKKKEFYNALSRGLRIGKGEKPEAIAAGTDGENYFTSTQGHALSLLEAFAKCYKDLTGAGLPATSKINNPNIVTHKQITGLLGLMMVFAKKGSKKNKEAIQIRVTQDAAELIKSYKNVPDATKPEVLRCLRYFESFLGAIGSNLSSDVGALTAQLTR